MKLPKSKLNKSIIKIGVLNGISGFLGFIYIVIVANFFGTSREIEIFFATSLLQQLTVRIMQTGQLAEIMIPIYHKIKIDFGEEAAFKSYGVIITWILLFLTSLIVLILLSAKFLVKVIIPGFDTTSQILAVRMIRTLAPLSIIQVFSIMIGNLSNAERYFGWPEMAGLISRMVNVLIVVSTYNMFKVWSLVIGLWLSSLTRVLVLIVFLIKRVKLYLTLSSPHIKIRELIKRISAATLYTGATQLYLTSLSAAFSYLPQGSYGAFQYAVKLADRLQGILLRPVGVVYFTEFSENVGRKNFTSNVFLFVNGLKKATLIAGLLCIPLAVSSYGLIKLIFGVKKVNASVDMVMFAFRIFMLLFLLKPVSLIYRKLVMAFQEADVYYSWAAAIQLISALGAYFIIPIMKFNQAILLVAGFNALLLSVPVVISMVKMRDFYWVKFLKYIVPVVIIFLSIFALITPFADRVYKITNDELNLAVFNIIFIALTFLVGSLSLILYKPKYKS